MNKKETIFETRSPEETLELGMRLAEAAKPGDVYVLTGDLGAGKTAFAKGVASGIGVREPVSSPTFTIVQIYEGGRMPLYHFDAYRISDLSEMDEIGYEDYIYGDGLSVIEWGGRIAEILPLARTDVRIEKDLEKGFDFRRITITEEGL